MPLPSDGTAWPPNEGRVAEELRENAAWYSGDRRQLESFYQAYSGTGPRPTTRPAQYAGGVAGAMARWFWGTPPSEGEGNARLHIPLAADLATTSSDLLFSESVAITPANDDGGRLAAYLADLKADGLDSRLAEAGELCAALGSTYLRVTWDNTLRPRPWTTAVHPDGALPEFRGGILVAVNLWTELSRLDRTTGVVHRMIERHESGAIRYALYQGTSTNLGKTVPLQDHPATEHLAALVNADGVQPTGTKRLTVSHVPNMLPDRRNRHSIVGRSDYQGVTGVFDALDETYSSWMRDIRHGKSRIHVPESLIESNGPGQGGSVNIDRELYVGLSGVLAKADKGVDGMLQAQQFAIRFAEHSATAKELRDLAVDMAGYSANGDGGDSGGAMTATEVRAKNRRSYMTRGKKARYWTAGLRDHLAALLEVANTQMAAGLGSDVEVNVSFPDGVQESALELAQTAQALRNAQAASTETLVKLVNPDMDDKQVAVEAARVLAENAMPPIPDPTDAGV